MLKHNLRVSPQFRLASALIVGCQLALAVLAPVLAAAEEPLAVLADGTRFRGEVEAADANWQFALRGGVRQRTVSAAELVYWGQCPERSGPLAILLADGGLVAAESVSVQNEKLMIDGDTFGGQAIALESLAGVVFHGSADPQRDDALANRIVQCAGSFDRLLLLNGDELSGRLAGIADDVVRFETDLGPVDAAADRVSALIFNPAARRHDAKPDRLRAWVGLSDGSRLLADRLVIAGDSMRLTAAGQTWKTARERLAFLQPLGGRAVYLSDVKPADYRQTPFLELPWPLRADRNVTGGMLRLAGRVTLKGLGVHSAARLVYALDGLSPRPLAGEGQGVRAVPPATGPHPSPLPEGEGTSGSPRPLAGEGHGVRAFQRFEAEVGIDDSTGGRGSAQFRVLVDGHERFASQIIRGGERPTPISVELRGGKRLELVVDYGDRADVLGHADWLDARLIK